MSEVYYFQRYHQKENVHSSNALLLLKRVYVYKSKLFYNILSSLANLETEKFLPEFFTQAKTTEKIKGKKSIPDFGISQGGFKIFVEAKEKGNNFTKDQMERHLENLKKEEYSVKILIALSPVFTSEDESVFEKLNLGEVIFVKITYLDLYNIIKEECDEIRDIEFMDILEEYREYCNEEKLIDETDNVIMARLAGQTMDFNIREDINLYFDGANHNYQGFKYIALYKDKALKYIGKIEKIANSNKKCLVSYNGKKSLTPDEIRRIDAGLKELERVYNTTEPHVFYLVDRFVPIDNFKKETPNALYGRKKFYLDKFGLKRDCSAEDIAICLKDKTW